MIFRKSIISPILGLGCLLTLPTLGYTQGNGQIASEIRFLKERIEQLEAQVKHNQQQVHQETSQTRQEIQTLSQKTEESSKSDIKIQMKPAPTISTADGRTTFALTARAMTDVGFVTSKDKADIANAADLRYLWMGFTGQIDNDWEYSLVAGFEDNKVSLKDAYVAYNGIDNVSVRVGNFYENNGFETFSGSTNTTMMEASTGIDTFHPLRFLGFSVDPYGQIGSVSWGSQFGVFGTEVNNNSDDDEGYSLAGRMHVAPVNTKDAVIHFGGNIRNRNLDTADKSISFDAKGESHVIKATLLDTGTISDVDSETDYALEGFFRYKGLSLQSEYTFSSLSRFNNQPDLEFQGGYATISYVLTGEQRKYDPKRGKVGGLSPKNPFSMSGKGWGAFELAGRYSHVDLNDGLVKGGELNAYTLGANWYPVSGVRLMMNYVINDVDSNAALPNEDPHYLMMRTQVNF